MKSRSGATHLVYADIMRTIAISAVVLNHFTFFSRPVVGHKALVFGYLGAWGVNCFFVLSGLLLGRPYLRAILDERAFPSVTGFYQRRFYRIYPLYVVAILFSIPLDYLYNHHFATLSNIGAHIFMLQTMWTTSSDSLNGPLWTMGIDAAFYLLLPVLAIAFAPLVRAKSLQYKAGAVAFTIGLASLSCIAYRYFAYSSHPDAVDDFATGIVFVRNLLGFTMSFGLGFAIALATLLNFKLSKAAASGMIFGGVALASIELVSRDGILGIILHAVDRHHVLSEAIVTIVRVTVLDPFAAISASAILFGFMQLEWGRAFDIAASKTTAAIASGAYAVYLIHWVLLENADRYILHERVGNVAFAEFVALGLALIIPVAYVLHRFVEKPFLTINERNRMSDVSSPVSAQAAT